MSDLPVLYWIRYRNFLPYLDKTIWSEYVNDQETFRRTFAMGCLHIPDSPSRVCNYDSPPMHMGCIQFKDKISLAKVVTNLIGIKKMQFRMERYVSAHY